MNTILKDKIDIRNIFIKNNIAVRFIHQVRVLFFPLILVQNAHFHNLNQFAITASNRYKEKTCAIRACCFASRFNNYMFVVRFSNSFITLGN